MHPPSSLCDYGAASQGRQRPHIIRQLFASVSQRLNLGLGSAVSVLIFACVVIIALLFLKGFGTALARGEGER